VLLGVRFPSTFPRLALCFGVLIAWALPTVLFFNKMISFGMAVVFSVALFVLVASAVRALQHISQSRLLYLLMDYCGRQATVEAWVAADREAKFHVFNGGGVALVSALLYYLGTKPLLEGAPAAEQAYITTASVVLLISWTVGHTLIYWCILVVQRLCCALLALAGTKYVSNMASTLRDVSSAPEARVAALTQDELRVQSLFTVANDALCTPLLLQCFALIIMGLAAAVGLVVRWPSATGALVVMVALVCLGVLGGVLLLKAMTHVADTFHREARTLHHALDLINLAEEVFPNNGGTFLARGQHRVRQLLLIPLPFVRDLAILNLCSRHGRRYLASTSSRRM
jgi:hypothetical protein